MKPALELDAIIAQLRTSWGGSAEGDTYPLHNANVQYAILASAPLDSSPENGGWKAVSALMAARAAEAFEAWDDLAAISLTPYAGNPPANASVIQFAYSSTTSGGGTYEYGVSGVFEGGNQYGGEQYGMTRDEIWLNSTWSTHSTSSALNQAGYGYYGGYGFMTYLHEIGHAMGLSHPGTYDASVGNPTYAKSAEYLQDTRRYTVMSYFDADADGSGTDHYGNGGGWLYAQTPMLDDVAAVQAIYGADMTTRSGDTVYGFHSTAGKDVYDFTKNANPILTIWDGGGIDTLDLSGFGPGQYGGQLIDLTPGGWSNVGGYMNNNVAIAYGAIIENAIGGSGDDTIVGNEANNTLTGGAGKDLIVGRGGVDVMFGGTGDDTYYVDVTADSVIESAGEGNDTVFSAAPVYTLGPNIENLTLASWVGAIDGYGNAAANTITGNASANLIWGGDGADAMIGGAGNDTYYVDNPADTVVELAGEGTDTVVASLSYTLGPNVENLVLASWAVAIDGYGNAGNNSITGNASANTIWGGDGTDVMTGGGGDDTYYVGNSSDVVIEAAGQGNDTVISSVTYVLGLYVENLVLGSWAGMIDGYGNADANTITGNASANLIWGGDGVDTMIGGAGNDTYYLDRPSDVAIENAGEGVDTVISSFSYSLGANFENLVLASWAGAINGSGNAGNNTITSNGSSNQLAGGTGDDWFVFNTPLGAGNLDLILDFNDANDTIVLDHNVFAALPLGQLPSNQFRLGDRPAELANHILYDKPTGALYYDADGDLSGAAVQFATLANGPSVSHLDFWVI